VVFAGSPGTITIAASGMTAHNITFNSTGDTVAGGTLSVATGTINVTSGYIELRFRIVHQAEM
jgi:hypothetical protein